MPEYVRTLYPPAGCARAAGVWHDRAMTFRGDLQRSTDRVSTSSGGRRGGIAVGGGLGGLVLVGLFLLLGGNPADIGLGGGGADQGQAEQGAQAYNLDHCETGADANEHDDCRVLYTAYSVDEVWDKVLSEQAGITYEKPGVEIFRDSVQTGCGFASAQTGPFYCPADQTLYLDVSFFEQLGQLGGEDAPLAQEYIVAHEFGHHIQNLEGTLGLSDYQNPGEDSNAVKIELQADCYGGIWAHYADSENGGDLEPISKEQLASAVETAGAVGDDNIQRRSGGEVNPEAFTHGSSQQRQEAFLAGYNSGEMAQCDTLDRGAYKS